MAIKRLAFIFALLAFAVAGHAQGGTMICNPPSEQIGTVPGTCVGTFPDISTAAATIYSLDTSQAPITQNVVTWTTTQNPSSVSVVVYGSSDCISTTSLNTSTSKNGSYVFAGTYCWVGVAATTLSSGVVKARYMGSAGLVNDLIGKLLYYNGIATAGWGMPAIYAAGRSTAQIAANASVATYTPTVDGTFEVSANFLATTPTSYAINVSVTYTDESNTSRSAVLPFYDNTSGLLVSLTNANNNGRPAQGIPLHIRCKANTAITIITSGTFTTITYNVEGIIRQLA